MAAKEIITGPVEVYVAPVGEAFPDLADAPAGNWVLLGTSGAKNQTEDGCTVRHSQTIETDAFRSAGGTGARKAARTAEDHFVEFTLMDLSSTEYAYALDGDATRVTDTAPGVGTAGNLNQDLMRGLVVNEQALLVRGDPKSSELVGGAMQYEVPIVVQAAELELAFVKGAPAGLRFMFQALEDPALGFGKLRIEDQVAT